MQYAYRLVFENHEVARKTYTRHFNAKAKARVFEVGDEVLVSFPVPQHLPNKKLVSVWKGPFKVTEVCQNNVLLLKATPSSKTIRAHVNRVVLYHHLIDIVVDPVAPNQPEVPAEHSSEELPADNSSEDHKEDVKEQIFVSQTPSGQPPAILQPPEPPSQPPPPPVEPIVLRRQEGQWRVNNLTPLDRLASELFGRHTCSRGPVQSTSSVPPDRPLEYQSQQKS